MIGTILVARFPFTAFLIEIVKIAKGGTHQNERRAPRLPKKSWHGQVDRLRLLAVAGIRIPGDLGPVSATPPDDVIDAAAAAWSAHRIAAGTGEKVGKLVPDLRPNRNAGFIWY